MHRLRDAPFAPLGPYGPLASYGARLGHRDRRALGTQSTLAPYEGGVMGGHILGPEGPKRPRGCR